MSKKEAVPNKPTRLAIFQQNGSGEEKIAGIKKFGHSLAIETVVNIDEALPEMVDTPEDYLPTRIDADVVLSFLKHPDLVDGLAALCTKLDIPMVAAGKKTSGAFAPFTCCGLGKTKKLGRYGEQFGFPEFRVKIEKDRISCLEVVRGASCGATWLITPRIVGLSPEEALERVAREVQYHCKADPSAFDPVSGKSPLHYAGDVHTQALKKALSEWG